MTRTKSAGSERFLVWLLSSDDDGDALEWCVSIEDSEEALAERLTHLQRSHESTFASAYRIERMVIADAGEFRPFVGTAKAGAEPESEPVIVDDCAVLF